MPVLDEQQPQLTSTAIAGGLVSSLRDPLKSSALLRDLNSLLTPSGLAMVHRELNAEDLAGRLSIPLSIARKIMNVHGDIQAGRYWRMTESRYAECVKKGRFKTHL